MLKTTTLSSDIKLPERFIDYQFVYIKRAQSPILTSKYEPKEEAEVEKRLQQTGRLINRLYSQLSAQYYVRTVLTEFNS